MKHPGLITTQNQLHDLCHTLAGAARIALDTEFIREKTYYPRLCLIQVATPEVVACIDPLAIDDLSPLLDRLYDPASLKLFHAGRQDLEILYRLRGMLPTPLFDTQLAAALLGHGDQVGYGPLVEQVLGIVLEKGHSRTDWSQRPLSAEQLAYAADDVRYLLPLHEALQQRLQTLGRASWLDEDFAALAAPESYQSDPAQQWQRLSGVNRLKEGRQRAIARALAEWREETAQQLDRPRKWVLSDEPLLDIARRPPRNRAALAAIRGIEARFVERHGEALLQVVESACQLPASAWPAAEERLRLTTEQEALSDALMATLRLCAHEAEVAPTTLASRRDLERIAAGERDLPLLHGWRAHLAGERLLALVEGRLSLRVDGSGSLGLHPT